MSFLRIAFTQSDCGARGREGALQGGGAKAWESYPRTGNHLHVVRTDPDLCCGTHRGKKVEPIFLKNSAPFKFAFFGWRNRRWIYCTVRASFEGASNAFGRVNWQHGDLGDMWRSFVCVCVLFSPQVPVGRSSWLEPAAISCGERLARCGFV